MARPRQPARRPGARAVLAVGLAGLAATACRPSHPPPERAVERHPLAASQSRSPPPQGAPWVVNLLRNPGFEEGRAGWTHMAGNAAWGDFSIDGETVRSGLAAARLDVRWPAGRPGQRAKVFGVVQEPAPPECPEVLAGWYRVDRWTKGEPATDLYVQAVVIVWGDPATDQVVRARGGRPVTNYQIRYYLAGLNQPPFRLLNAKLVFVQRGPPALNRWIRFEIPLRDDFERLWGHVPSGYQFLRVLFEARWDNKPPGSAVDAIVFYDDLYLGPRSGSSDRGVASGSAN